MNKNPLFIPNSTQVPNIVLDYLLPKLPPAELKCFLYIIRRTYGFRKKSDLISLSQFEAGVKNKDGNQLDYGTGLARSTIISALKNLLFTGLIIKTRTLNSFRYTIELSVDMENVIDKISRNKRDDSKFIQARLHQPQLF